MEHASCHLSGAMDCETAPRLFGKFVDPRFKKPSRYRPGVAQRVPGS